MLLLGVFHNYSRNKKDGEESQTLTVRVKNSGSKYVSLCFCQHCSLEGSYMKNIPL